MNLEQAMVGVLMASGVVAFGRELAAPPTRQHRDLTISAGQNLPYGVSVYSWYPPHLEAI